jgi:hypothetical protein
MMRCPYTRWIGLALVLAVTFSAHGADEPRLAEYYGFKPLEIYKLDPRIMGVQICDLDGDKVGDILVINNGRSRIDLLLSSKGPAEGDEPAAKGEPNYVPSDRRMRTKSLPVNKEVVSIQTGDFNGDGKPDIAYYGTPAELIVVFNKGGAEFGDTRRFNTGEAVESGTALTVGDLNRDGKDDLALLTATEVVTILQQPGGRLADPERLPHTSTTPRILKAVDLDGDGGDDLVILDGGNDDPIRVRFSGAGGKLGPEGRFTTESPRAIAFANLDGRPGVELLAIEGQSGRARVLTLDESDEEGVGSERKPRLIFYPLPRGDNRGRSLAIGDLDGDGKSDVVVTDPANAQFIVYRQGKGGLGTAQTFPGLAGGKTVRTASLGGAGKAEVVVLSEAEKQVGRSVLNDGRLSFPEALPTSGEPVALEVADLDGDKVPEVLYAVSTGKEGAEAYALRGLKREASGSFIPFRWGQDDSVAIKGLSNSPTAIRVVDANGDKQADILAFRDYATPILLLGRADEPPAAAGGSPGPLVGATPAGVATPVHAGAGLLIAQSTYARDVVLDKGGQWKVRDQYNAGRGSAQIVGAAALDLDGDGTPEIALLDKNRKALLFLERKDGVYRPGGQLSVGPLDFQGMHVADLDGDGRDDLLLAGTDRFAVVLSGRKGQRLKALAGYESNRKEAHLGDLIAGDLNGDGRPDVVLTDTAEHFIEVIAVGPGAAELDRALSFKVFERKSFRDVDRLVEPRDLALGDVDGDGRTDLVLIVHDRILIYRQDVGKEAAAK